jgi:riboflavin kinase/FMN adenylyltransferase
MKVYDELPALPATDKTVLTIGVFDGVHLGHQKVLNQVKQAANDAQALSCAITFTEHPRAVLSKNSGIKYITSLDNKISLLKSEGLDLVIPLTFDLDLSKLRARDFCRLLKDRINLTNLIIGHDFVMGFQREGTPAVLKDIGEKQGFSVNIVDQVSNSGIRVSSTAIREAISSGNVAVAANYLGRLFRLEGKVTKGAGIGRKLGFPTANLDVKENRLIPGDGIYATWAYVGGTRYKSATSIGFRPTFDGNDHTIEVHIIDFDQDIYDRHIEIEFFEYIREEVRFNSEKQLVDQMGLDINQTRNIMP